jgi:hypothetical protein
MGIGSKDPLDHILNSTDHTFSLSVLSTEKSNPVFQQIVGKTAETIQVVDKVTQKVVWALTKCLFEGMSSGITTDNTPQTFDLTGRFTGLQFPDA